jgi:hypothetical protein
VGLWGFWGCLGLYGPMRGLKQGPNRAPKRPLLNDLKQGPQVLPQGSHRMTTSASGRHPGSHRMTSASGRHPGSHRCIPSIPPVHHCIHHCIPLRVKQGPNRPETGYLAMYPQGPSNRVLKDFLKDTSTSSRIAPHDGGLRPHPGIAPLYTPIYRCTPSIPQYTQYTPYRPI